LKTIGIFPNTEKDSELLGTVRVIGALCGKASMLVSAELRDKLLPSLSDEERAWVRFTSENELFLKSDAVITLGGDGTIIKAARGCAKCATPILGINLGRLGYLAEIEIDEIGLLDKLISGDCKYERRMMLEVEIGNEKLFALNEAVIGGTSIFRIVDIELYCGESMVNRYRADGIIASTPTGSTAYSMSAGGAVVDPQMEALLITPICSHSLNATPLVFASDSELSVKNVTGREEYLMLNVDGCQARRIGYGETVKLRRSDDFVTLIKLKDGGFYEVLRRKMADE